MNENDRGTEIKKNLGMKKKRLLLSVVEWEGTRIKTSNGIGWYKIWNSNVQVYIHTITTLHYTTLYTLHYIHTVTYQYTPLHQYTKSYHTIPYHTIPYHANICAYIHTCISMFNARMAKTQGDPEASFLSVTRQPLYRFATKIRGNTFRRLLHFVNIPTTLTPRAWQPFSMQANSKQKFDISRNSLYPHINITGNSVHLYTETFV